MRRLALSALALTGIIPLLAADDPAIFKSEVSMTRVDAQVVDSTGRPITGLEANDFVLRVDGKVQPIRNFATESVPLDVLLLLDVSASMKPHVQRIADASAEALRVLAPQDRIGIMVFDTRAKVRLSFREDHGEVTNELQHLIDAEHFNGGTRVVHALLDAAKYVGREARPEARRAIVILTDDQTQDGEAGYQVQQALDESNAVLSFLQAPYEDDFYHGGRPHGRSGPWGGSGGGGGPWGGGTTWPGGGTGWPGGGGQRLPGGVSMGDPSHSAGTATAAKDSGGDVMNVEQASAFEDTLERLRHRYALNFYWPAGASNPETRTVTVALAHSTGERYEHAEVRYRRAYVAKSATRRLGGLTEISREADPVDPSPATVASNEKQTQPATGRKRRAAVDDSSSPRVNSVDLSQPAARASQPANPNPATPVQAPKHTNRPAVNDSQSPF